MVEPAKSEKRCPSCLANVPEQATTCPKCGSELNAVKLSGGSLQEEERESQASKLVKLAFTEQPQLFHDERKVPYILLQKSSRQILRLRSTDFRMMLARLLWKSEGKVPGSEAITSALNVLHAHALEGPSIPLHNRVAGHEGALHIDMCDEKGRAIKVTKDGWEIVAEPPILFRRYPHQQPLPEPVHGGDPWRLLDFTNIRKEDELLALCYVAMLFLPGFPHLLLALYGQQGSAKTTLMELARSLVDPSVLGVRSLPRDERELTQDLDHSWVCFYDNVSFLPDWASDALSRAVTGTGFGKRQLYTDDEDILYWVQRPIGLNGINVAPQKADLLDRCLLIGLEQIPDEKRRDLKALKTEFEREKPSILGGFLDVLVKALGMPEPSLERNFRMADAVLWGYRITEALGRSGKDFVDQYAENVQSQAKEAVKADVVAEVLIEYLDATLALEWEGTATELIKLLKREAEERNVSTRQRTWPKSTNALARRLRQLKTPLARLGYEVEFDRVGKSGVRVIRVAKAPGRVAQKPSESSEPSADGEVKEPGADDIAKRSSASSATSSAEPPSEPRRKSMLGGDADDTDDTDDVSPTLRGDSERWLRMKAAAGYEYRPTPRGEPCERCGLYASEYEVRGLGILGVKRLCPSCFREDWGRMV